MKSTVQCCGNRVGNAAPLDRLYVDRRKDNSGISGAFSDPRILLVTPFDERFAVLPQIDAKHCQAQQGQDSPTYLVIGPNVTDESLLRASERFGIPLLDLVAFRAANDDAAQLPIWRPVVEVLAHDGSHVFERLGDPMPKQKAWEIAQAAMDGRSDVVSMSVRREGDRFTYFTKGEQQ